MQNNLTVFTVDYEKRTTTWWVGVHNKEALEKAVKPHLGPNHELLVLSGNVHILADEWATNMQKIETQLCESNTNLPE